MRQPATRVERNPWWLALGGSPAAIAIAALIAAVATGDLGVLRIVPVALFFALFGLARTWTANRSPRFVPGEVEVDADAVRFAGEIVARRGEIHRALWRVDPQVGPMVQLSRRRRAPVTLLLPTATAAQDLVRQLGFDASERAVTFTCMSRAFDVSVGARAAFTVLVPMLPVVIGIATRIGFGPSAGLAAGAITAVGTLAALATVLAWQLAPSRVDVGADGVLVRWLGRSTFVPYRDVASVEAADFSESGKRFLAIELDLTSGDRRRIVVRQDGLDDGARDLLLARIAESLERHRRGAPAGDVASLARGGRDVAAWIAALRGLGAGADGGPRRAALPLERLWSVVEDAGRDAISRAAAAVALAPVASPDERERLRSLARSSAEPRLRIAIERAADADADEDAALVEALAELEAAARPAAPATGRRQEEG